MAEQAKVTETPAPASTEPTPPAPPAEAKPARKAKDRREKFEAIRPDGTVVIVDRNIDTGDQTVTEK